MNQRELINRLEDLKQGFRSDEFEPAITNRRNFNEKISDIVSDINNSGFKYEKEIQRAKKLNLEEWIVARSKSDPNEWHVYKNKLSPLKSLDDYYWTIEVNNNVEDALHEGKKVCNEIERYYTYKEPELIDELNRFLEEFRTLAYVSEDYQQGAIDALFKMREVLYKYLDKS